MRPVPFQPLNGTDMVGSNQMPVAHGLQGVRLSTPHPPTPCYDGNEQLQGDCGTPVSPQHAQGAKINIFPTS